MRAIPVDAAPPQERDDDAFSRLVRWQDGIITRPQALRFRSARSIQRAIASTRWRAVYRGIYATQPGRLDTDQRHWAAVLAAGGDLAGDGDATAACLGGLSALLALGLQRVPADAIHVLVPAARRVRAPAGVCVHRTRAMPAWYETGQVRPPATLASRSVVDAVQWARSDDEARLIVAASFQQRLVSLREVEAVLERFPNATRRRLLLRTAWDWAGGSHTLTGEALVKAGWRP